MMDKDKQTRKYPLRPWLATLAMVALVSGGVVFTDLSASATTAAKAVFLLTMVAMALTATFYVSRRRP